jgi:hypothetical protein
MADLMQGLLAGMESPLFGMGAGLMSGRDFGSGMQQGFNNMQVQRGLQQRQDYATSQMVQRVAEQRQKRQAQEQALVRQQALASTYNLPVGQAPTSQMINANALPGGMAQNLGRLTEKGPLVQNIIGGEQTQPQIITGEAATNLGLDPAGVYQQDKNGMIKTVQSPIKESDEYAKLDQVQQSADSYRAKLKKYGTSIVPSGDKLIMKGAFNDLLLEAKELYNLGVLQGPDLEIMNAVMQDPTVWESQLYSGDDLVKQLDSVFGEKLKAARGRLDTRYGKTPVDKGNVIMWEDMQ